MFAVVQAGGRQVKMAPSEVIRIDLVDAEPGSEILFRKVLLLRTAEQTHVGRPTVEGAEVRVEVLGEEKGEKLRVFFYRRRKNNKKMRGHRQHYTSVRVSSLLLNGQVLESEAKSAPAPEAAAPAPEAAAPAPEAAAPAPEAAAPAPEAAAPAPEAAAQQAEGTQVGNG